MISGIVRKHLHNRKRNKGAALVMVIVAIAFIGMLVAMILYTSYANYIMKGSDRRSKDNFYSAEYALDVINAGIQTDISKYISIAYVNTMQYSAGLSASDMTDAFHEEFKKRMLADIQVSPSDKEHWKTTYITDKWTGNGVFEVSGTPGTLPVGAAGSACLESVASGKLDITHSDYFDIKGIKITYTDKNGFVSMISTDIRVTIPNLDFAQASSMLSVERFSIIANDELLDISDRASYLKKSGVDFNDHYTSGFGDNVTITGSVFGGYDGIQLDNQKTMLFASDEKDIANSDATGDPLPNYLLVANNISVDNCKDSSGVGFRVEGDTFETYVSNINVNTANLSLRGNTYVADDLEISGRNSVVTLAGNYKGYGNTNTGPAGSSSILINGVDTVLDFAQLDNLSLAGHAYVGATKYDADVKRQRVASSVSANAADPEDKFDAKYDIGKADQYDSNFDSNNAAGDLLYPQNKNDVMMGQSIAVKAEQLSYMVPSDCVGYDKDEKAYVKQKNPLTYDEYITLLETKSSEEVEKNADGTEKVDANGNKIYANRYDIVNLTNLKNKFANSAVLDNVGYRPVFRRVSGSVLVYLYLDFGNKEDMANEFYRLCYEANPDMIDNYIESYVKDIAFSPALVANSDTSLNLGGNAFYFDNGKVVFQKDTTDNAKKLNILYNEAETIAEKYTAAMYSLQTDYDLMGSGQEGVEIFNYLVPDESVLGALSTMDLTDGTVHAVVSDKDVFVGSSFSVPMGSTLNGTKVLDPDNTHLIITSKDVYLNKDFTGLIIAGGRVIVGSGCTKILYDPSLTVQALKAYCDDGSNRRYAYEALGVNGIATYGVISGGGSANDISIRDLVTYQNWKKE